LPVTQDALQREQAAREAMIGRQVGSEESRIGRQTATELQRAQQSAGLGGQEMQRRLSEIDALAQTGGLERGVESERAAAEYQDFLRRQGLAEQSAFGVLGQTPSSYGTQASGRQGLFKG
jgi:hypothetical protein